MKKRLIILSTIVFSLFLTHNVYAASGDYTQAENIVTIDTTNVTDADDISFQASAQVNISGQSSATSFAHGAYHAQVEGKKNGRQFGMAADSSSIFWQEIETTAVATIDATTSAEFTGWIKM